MSKTVKIFCTLTSEEQRIRRSRVRCQIVPLVSNIIVIANGLRIEFEASNDLRTLIEEFITLEKGCCDFLTFSLSEPSEDLMLLIEGGPNAAHVIDIFRQTLETGIKNE